MVIRMCCADSFSRFEPAYSLAAVFVAALVYAQPRDERGQGPDGLKIGGLTPLHPQLFAVSLRCSHRCTASRVLVSWWG